MAQSCVLYAVQRVDLVPDDEPPVALDQLAPAEQQQCLPTTAPNVAPEQPTTGTLYVQEQPKNAPSVSGGLAAAADHASHSGAVNPYQIAILWAPADHINSVQAFQFFLEDVLTIRIHGPLQLTIAKKGAVLLPRMEFTGPEIAPRFLRVLRGYASLVEYPEDHKLLHVQSAPKPRRTTASFLHLGRSFTPSHVLLSPRAAATTTTTSPDQARYSSSSSPRDGRPPQQQGASIRSRRSTATASMGSSAPSRAGPRARHTQENDIMIEVRKSHLGFAVLSQFAQVTKTVRGVGAEIGTFIDEGVRAISARGGNNIPAELAANLEGLLFGSDGYQPPVLPPAQERPAPASRARSDMDERQMPEFYEVEAPRGVPVSRHDFLAAFSEPSGTLKDVLTLRQALFDGGAHPDARGLVWPFLLDVYVWDMPAKARASLLVELCKEYDALKAVWQPTINEPASQPSEPATAHAPNPPDIDGVEVKEDDQEDNEQETVQEPNDQDIRNDVKMAWNILGQARDGSFGDIDVHLKFPSERLRDQSLQIAKDVLRTDRMVEELTDDQSPLMAQMTLILMTYGVRTPHIGYCQGMSDILTPILYAMRNEPCGEALSFWCFTKLMDRINANFREDQSGIRAQLRKLRKLLRLADRDLANHFSQIDPDYHACFRWLLVQFKREFSFEAIPRLWEVIWMDFVAERELHLYIAVGLLIQHREDILSFCDSFPELLRFVNDMSMRIDVDLALSAAVDLFYRLGPVEVETSKADTSLRRGNSQDPVVNRT